MTKKILLCLLGLHVAMLPCFADIIPARYPDKSPASQQTVKQRIQDLGAPSGSAEFRSRALTDEELAYFAQDPARIQNAGGLYWYEWLLGAATLGVAVGLVVFYQQEYEEQL